MGGCRDHHRANIAHVARDLYDKHAQIFAVGHSLYWPFLASIWLLAVGLDSKARSSGRRVKGITVLKNLVRYDLAAVLGALYDESPPVNMMWRVYLIAGFWQRQTQRGPTTHPNLTHRRYLVPYTKIPPQHPTTNFHNCGCEIFYANEKNHEGVERLQTHRRYLIPCTKIPTIQPDIFTISETRTPIDKIPLNPTRRP